MLVARAAVTALPARAGCRCSSAGLGRVPGLRGGAGGLALRAPPGARAGRSANFWGLLDPARGRPVALAEPGAACARRGPAPERDVRSPGALLGGSSDRRQLHGCTAGPARGSAGDARAVGARSAGVAAGRRRRRGRRPGGQQRTGGAHSCHSGHWAGVPKGAAPQSHPAALLGRLADPYNGAGRVRHGARVAHRPGPAIAAPCSAALHHARGQPPPGGGEPTGDPLLVGLARCKLRVRYLEARFALSARAGPAYGRRLVRRTPVGTGGCAGPATARHLHLWAVWTLLPQRRRESAVGADLGAGPLVFVPRPEPQ